ncbi:MAG: hypothetical protein ACFNZV_07670 [Rothia dentocariosa]
MTARDENTLMLAANFREAYEARTRLRDSQVPQERRELLERLGAQRRATNLPEGRYYPAA